MIDYLILLWLAKYREALLAAHGIKPQPDPMEENLAVGAGLIHREKPRERPKLRVVK